jgi:disulfide bond formation protein DsbB
MQTTILDWLVADFSVFGLRAQNWMLIIFVFLVLYVFVVWLGRKKFSN